VLIVAEHLLRLSSSLVLLVASVAPFELRAALGRAASDVLDAKDDRAEDVFEPLPRTV
jgi:hypothetical protein